MPYKDPDRQRRALKEMKRRQRSREQAIRTGEKTRAIERQVHTPVQAKNAVGEEAAHIIAEWSESKLKVPTGPLAGQPLIAHPYMLDWTAAALSDDITEAGMSIARKNAKTGWIAVCDLAFLIGPLNRREWRGVVTSMTGKLALEMRSAIEKTAKASGLHGLEIHRSPTPGIAYGLKGAQLDFLAADKASGHAIGGDIAIIDEGGLMDEGQRELWNSIDSATSGRDGKLWVLSIQGTGPMFAEMEARAKEGADYLHWHRWAAPEDCRIDDVEAWHAANPGLEVGIKSMRFMETRCEKALAVPADQPTFRAQHLNQSITPGIENLVSLTDWLAAERRIQGMERKGPLVLGLDMGSSDAMTAAAPYWPESGRLEFYAAFPGVPNPVLRGQKDGVGGLYQQMVNRGDLWIDEGSQLVTVPQFLSRVFAEIGQMPLWLVADKHRQSEVATALRDFGYTGDVIWRGGPNTQTDEGAHDVRAFQAGIKRRIGVTDSTVALHALKRSSVKYRGVNKDVPVLGKTSFRSRIDVLQAAVLSVGLSSVLGYEDVQQLELGLGEQVQDSGLVIIRKAS